MHQVAPYPDELAGLVKRLRYRRHMGWSVHLDPDLERDHADVHAGPSRGLTLVVTRCGPNSYHPEQVMVVNHYFPVTPATYDLRSWQRWLFDRLGDVDTHERMEDFALLTDDGNAQVRPYAPNHGPGNDPYRVCEYAEDIDRRTSFRGDVNGG
jgi:hypothetical protein